MGSFDSVRLALHSAQDDRTWKPRSLGCVWIAGTNKNAGPLRDRRFVLRRSPRV